MTWYKYRGVPLSPAVFAELAVKHSVPGTPVSRRELISFVRSVHLDNGGLPPNGSAVGTAKKALQALAAKGLVDNPAVGYWRFTEPDDAKSNPVEIDEEAETLAAGIEVGEGAQAVYVYYFPTYRELARFDGRDRWPMKIGMTVANEVHLRVREQIGTAMPERPILGLVYRTNVAGHAERVLHGMLEVRGRRITAAPGHEWYDTNLDEVQEILTFATGTDAVGHGTESEQAASLAGRSSTAPSEKVALDTHAP